MRLILVRHGNTFEAGQTPTQVGARTDLSLTAQGRKQAEEVARYLASQSIHPAAIFAGTLKRQTETAEIIARHLNIHPKLHEPALTEIDYGAWEGLTSEEIIRRWPNEYADWTEAGKWADAIFGGSLQNHLSCIEQWLTTLRKTYAPNDTIVAVSSNGLIRFLPTTKRIENLKVKTGHFCEFELNPNSLNVKSWNVKPLYIDSPHSASRA